MKCDGVTTAKKTITATVKRYGPVAHVVAPSINMFLRTEFFDSSLKGNPRFFLKDSPTVLGAIPFKDRLVFPTPDFLTWYRSGVQYCYPEGKARYVSPNKVDMDSASPESFVADLVHYDGFMYDIHGKPLWRPFCVDYISTPYKSPSYDVHPILDALLKVSKVTDVKIADIPYYNRDERDFDGKAVVFKYLPSPKEFSDLLKQNEVPSTHTIMCHVRKKLPTFKKYRRYAEET